MAGSESLSINEWSWSVSAWIRRNVIDAAPLWAQLYRSARANVRVDLIGPTVHRAIVVGDRRHARIAFGPRGAVGEPAFHRAERDTRQTAN